MWREITGAVYRGIAETPNYHLTLTDNSVSGRRDEDVKTGRNDRITMAGVVRLEKPGALPIAVDVPTREVRSVSRHFVGWDRPVLTRAADWLFEDAPRLGLSRPSPIRGEVDLSGVIVVVPVNRAGRTLATTLVTRAEARGILLSLPTIVTPGQLVDRMYGVEAADASDLAVQLAMAGWMREAEEDAQAIFRRDVGKDSIRAQLRMAQMIQRSLAALGAEDILAGEVPERMARAEGGAGLATFRAEQWRALAAITESVVERLGAEGLMLGWHRQLRMVRNGATNAKRSIVMIATSELAALARRAVRSAAEAGMPVHALIPTPERMAERFTPTGTLRTRGVDTAGVSWSGELPIATEDLTCVVSASDQAEAALAHIAQLAERDEALTASDVVIAVPDAEVTVALESLAPLVQGTRGIKVRSAAETPLVATGIATTTLSLVRFIEQPTLRTLITLVTQPDVERAVTRHLEPAARPRWMQALDRHAAEQPDHGLNVSQLQGAAQWPGAKEKDRATLAKFGMAMRRVLGPLIENRANDPGAIAGAVLATLANVYGERRVARNSFEGRSTLGPINTIREMVSEIRGLSAALAAPLRESGDVTRATLAALSALIEDATIAPEPSRDAIELLGWLDAVMDPARVLVLTGMNEGRVPSAHAADALLPEQLRGALLMPTSRDRVERDAYMLEIARRTHQTHMVCGRRTDAGDPLLPSRLVLQDAETLAERILTAQSPPPLTTRMERRVLARPSDTFAVRPIVESPLEAAGPPSMSVTSFAEYLASPYGYYLRHALKLREKDAPMAELPPQLFGSLIHSALKAWSDSDARNSDDADLILDALDDGLRQAAITSLGGMRRVEVEMQLLIAMARLRHFSSLQAERAKAGWRVLHTEWCAPAPGEPGCPELEMRDQPAMPLTGRIDRIDYHEASKTIAIIDYKTSNEAARPDNPHTRGDDEPYQDVMSGGLNPEPPGWKNLQLPLYRHLARSIVPEGAGVKYFLLNLPRQAEEVGLAEFAASENVLESADAAARWVVRNVRLGRFAAEGKRPPTEGTFGYLAGQGLFVTGRDASNRKESS